MHWRDNFLNPQYLLNSILKFHQNCMYVSKEQTCSPLNDTWTVPMVFMELLMKIQNRSRSLAFANSWDCCSSSTLLVHFLYDLSVLVMMLPQCSCTSMLDGLLSCLYYTATRTGRFNYAATTAKDFKLRFSCAYNDAVAMVL